MFAVVFVVKWLLAWKDSFWNDRNVSSATGLQFTVLTVLFF